MLKFHWILNVVVRNCFMLLLGIIPRSGAASQILHQIFVFVLQLTVSNFASYLALFTLHFSNRDFIVVSNIVFLI